MFEKFPIMFFAVIMGLCGFVLATLELGVDRERCRVYGV